MKQLLCSKRKGSQEKQTDIKTGRIEILIEDRSRRQREKQAGGKTTERKRGWREGGMEPSEEGGGDGGE